MLHEPGGDCHTVRKRWSDFVVHRTTEKDEASTRNRLHIDVALRLKVLVLRMEEGGALLARLTRPKPIDVAQLVSPWYDPKSAAAQHALAPICC